MRVRSKRVEAKEIAPPVLRPFTGLGVPLPVNYYKDWKPWTRAAGYTRQGYLSSLEATSDLQSGDTHGSWNSFEHYVQTVRVPEQLVTLQTDHYSGMWPIQGHTIQYPDVGWAYNVAMLGEIDAAPSGNVVLYDSDQQSGFVPLPSQLPVWELDMVRTMLNQSRPETSLVNSVLELRDLKSLASTVQRARKLADKVVNTVPSLARIYNTTHHSKKVALLYAIRVFSSRFKRKRPTLLDVLKFQADVLLQWNFGLGPLISDLEAIQKSFETALRRIDKIYESSGQRRIVRYFRNLPVGVYSSSDKEYTSAIAAGPHSKPSPEDIPMAVTSKRSVRYGKAVLHGQMEFTQYAPNLEKGYARILGLLDELGVNFNPSIIWNATPYTFLIDYLVGVSRFLDQFKIDNVQPVTVIHRFCYSVNVERVTLRKIRIGEGSDYDSGERTVSVVSEKAYRRISKQPDLVTALQNSGLSSREFSLSTALVIAKLPTRKRRSV